MSAIWMNTCPDCVRVLRSYDTAYTPEVVDAARELILAHLVTGHRDRLVPGPADCEKCAGFTRVLNLGPGMVTPAIRQVLTRADDRHRAEHLLALAPEIERRRAA